MLSRATPSAASFVMHHCVTSRQCFEDNAPVTWLQLRVLRVLLNGVVHCVCTTSARKDCWMRSSHTQRHVTRRSCTGSARHSPTVSQFTQVCQMTFAVYRMQLVYLINPRGRLSIKYSIFTTGSVELATLCHSTRRQMAPLSPSVTVVGPFARWSMTRARRTIEYWHLTSDVHKFGQIVELLAWQRSGHGKTIRDTWMDNSHSQCCVSAGDYRLRQRSWVCFHVRRRSQTYLHVAA